MELFKTSEEDSIEIKNTTTPSTSKKSIIRVRARGERKLKRNYYPVKVKKTSMKSTNKNYLSTKAVDEKTTTMSTTTSKTTSTTTINTTTTLSTSTTTTTPKLLLTNRLSYVDINRDNQENISDDKSFADQQETLIVNRDLDFSRKLPPISSISSSFQPSVSNARTSSRLLYPPSIKRHSNAYPSPSSSPSLFPSSTTASSVSRFSPTANPFSFFTATTPEFNHVSYLTHPNNVDTIKLTTPSSETSRAGVFGPEFERFQTNFRIIGTVSPSPKPSRAKNIKSHSFFQMGHSHQSTTTKRSVAATTTYNPPARSFSNTFSTTLKPKKHKKKHSSISKYHASTTTPRTSFHEERQFVSLQLNILSVNLF